MAGRRPDKPIRRSGLISPFGVGAIVDYADGQSLMTSAIDHWPSAFEECPPALKINEERLCDALGINEIRFPPDFENHGAIPAARFPAWQHCPKCHAMRNQIAARDCSNPDCVKSRSKTLPMRFIAICPKGHIEDIDWMRWVHGEDGRKDGCALRYRAGRSSTLAGITISCSCGKKRTLSGLFSPDQNNRGLQQSCSGHRPWLGPDANEPCDQSMQAAQKGASNVYFPKVESAIFIPDWLEDESNRIRILLDDPANWEMVEATLEQDKKPNAAVLQTWANRHNLDAAALYNAAFSKLTGQEEQSVEVEIKPAEYAAITSCAGSPDEELFVKKADMERYESWVGDYFSDVFLIPKLRETRVLRGFSRLQPPGGSDDQRIQPVCGNIRWLPGIKVTGEGFMIVFDVDKVRSFGLQADAAKRAECIQENINRVNQKLGREEVRLAPEELMLHTFAHVLIRALAYECGYGSSALRERIYVDLDAERPMAGVMVYTASGDSEGSLGGIVRQAEPGRLERTIIQGLKSADWCSSDPVCSETEGQGSNGANLAACHACALLPETACEYGNRMLDRMVLLGSAGNRSLGYFGRLVETL